MLGPVEAEIDGTPVDLGGPKQRSVLAILALDANRAVSSDRLIEALWTDDPPASATATLQSYVSRLRRALGSDAVESTSGGYRLRIDPDALDVARFERLAKQGRDAFAAADPATATARLTEALDLWRGEPLGDLAMEAWALADVERLVNLHAAATEDRIDADLALGRHGSLIGELELLVARYPVRERLRGQLMLALYRSGRQADALASYHAGRRILGAELGLEPGRALQELEGAILRQDPALDVAPGGGAAGAATGPAAAVAAAASSLIGRDAELERLRAALEASVRTGAGRSPRGRVAMITGEPGIGKTRLAEELAELAKGLGADVVWGRCWEAGGAPAYWPWAQALRHRLAGLDQAALEDRFGDRLPSLVGAVPWLFDADQVPDVEGRSAEVRFVVFAAAATILQVLAAERPLVVILDDLHAADEPSLLLLRFLGGEIANAPICLVSLARSGEGTDAVRGLLTEIAGRAQPRIDLAGLPTDAILQLVERETGRLPSDGVVDTISADTGGNPLFVAEVARAMRSGEGVEGVGAGAPGARGRPRLSRGLRELIARRAGGLSARCRDALVHASVIGREFDLPTLAATQSTTPADLFDAIDEAIRVGLLVEVADEPGRYRFAHALMRETLYDALPPSSRLRMHRDVGVALEAVYGDRRDAHLAELAHHFFEAVPVAPPEQATMYAELGAARALRDLAYEEAVRLYRVALRSMDLFAAGRERRIDVLLGLGESEARAGDLEGSRRTLKVARDLGVEAGSVERVARAALGYGGRFGWSRQNGDPDILPMLEDALERLGDANPQLRARLLARLAGARRDDWSREPRNSLSAEAVAIARRAGDADTLAYALETRFRSTWWVENAAARVAIADELCELASHTHDRERIFEAHLARSDGLWEMGRIPEAKLELEIASRAADALGQPAQLNMVISCRAVDALRQGRLAAAEEYSTRSFLIGAASEGPEAVVAHRMQMALIRREQGRLAEVKDDLIEVFRVQPNRWVIGCVVAAVHASLGDVVAARQALEQLGGGDLDRLPLDNEYLFGMSLLPEACLVTGDVVRAEQLYRLLLPHRDRDGADLEDADTGSIELPLGRLAVQLGRADAAAEHFRAAIAANDHAEAHLWSAWARYELGSLLVASDPMRADEGRQLLAAAQRAADSLNLTLLDARAEKGGTSS